MSKNRERDSETYKGPSKSGSRGNQSVQPENPAFDKKLDGPNRPSV
ncbi:hypothetical protein [Paenibacillus sambharensis]|nr:hypothetical protein [Paenibacillus sambharensis]